ncbi:MAG TPA: hypothetical protein VG937_07585 [Polyangiaceae bacterium]|jgi:hypothetical protein|nr:hypothetical protein [Polyangiaceae bacterium]
MNEHDPSVELNLLAALRREMQRPADEAVAKDVATRLGATLGIGLSVAAPAMAAGSASSSLAGAASAAGTVAAKLSAGSHPLLAPLAVLVGSAAVTGLSLFGVLSFSEPPAAPSLEVRKARSVVAKGERNSPKAQATSADSAAAVSASSDLREPARAPTRPASTAGVPLTSAAAASSTAPAEASLGTQQALLDTARRALSRGASAAALEALSEHASRFPRSVLEEEREALTVKALRAAQRNAEADQRAARFASRYPSSVFLPSVAPSIP